MTLTDFPREDLEPLRHQQVRALLVREAGSVTTSRHRSVRRAAPVVAALAVAGTALAAPTGLPGRVSASVGALVDGVTNPCPPHGDVGYSPQFRPPGPDDDTAAVRRLPSGPAQVGYFYLSSACVLPERPDRPVFRPRAVWTIARVDGSGRVEAVATLWRGLAEGISQQVADRTSQRLPTDEGDPGTVLDPPFEAVQVRGTTGTLTRRGNREPGDELTVVWTEPGGRQWSLRGGGLALDDLLALAEGLDVDGDVVTPRPDGARVLTPEQARLAYVVPPYWLRLDVPAGEDTAAPGDVVRTPSLSAVVTTAEGQVFYGVTGAMPGFVPWQARLLPGDRIVDVGGRDGVLDRSGDLTWSPAEGAEAGLRSRSQVRVPEQTLLDLAASVRPVPLDDPRLAAVDGEPD